MASSKSDAPNGTPDPVELFDVDTGVLDFNRSWPRPLLEPDKFSAHLHDWAEKSLGRLEVQSSFLKFVPFHNVLSKETWSELDEILYGFIAELRVAQGEMALFQPSQATEFQKVRAIVPAAPALLRLDDWIVNLTRPDAGLYEWNALTPIAQGPIEVDYCGDLTKKIPQNFPQVGAGGYIPFDHALHLEVVALRQATLKLRDIFGAPDAWVKRPHWATCESLVRAWVDGNLDFDDYLTWMRRHEFRLSPIQLCRACKLAQSSGQVPGANKRNCKCYDAWLDAYIMQVLLDVRTSHHDMKLGTEMENLRKTLTRRGNGDSDVYTEILRLARNRKMRDETPQYGTVHDDKQPVLSLDAPEAGAIDDLFAQQQLNQSFRWRYRLDWAEVAQALDDRTARELEQMLSGASVEDMDNSN